MKGNWKKIAVGGVSIGLAVALLANSLTSHKPVQAVDVFSQTKSLVKPSLTDSFDIVELISERSTFPQVLFNKIEKSEGIVEENFEKISEGSVHIGKEELAYMVGGEEPFAKFWEDLIKASWMVTDLQQSIQINTFKDSLIAGLENAGLLDINDITGYPLKVFIGENFVRPDQLDKILDNAFLEVMAYPNDDSNEDIIGYFVPMEGDTGCYMWDADARKMKYVGARVARAEAAMHIEFQSGWNSNLMGDWEAEEDLDDEYEYDDFWEEYEIEDGYEYDFENDYADDYFYDPGYEIHQNENGYTYIENGDASEERIVEYYYPDEEYTQSTVEVEIPTYQASLVLGANVLDGNTDGDASGDNNDQTGEDASEDLVEPVAGRMYNFYTKAEIEAQETNGLDENQIVKFPVYGNAVGDLRVFRYITLSNNEWLKTQVFGIEESTEDNAVKFANYPIHVYSVTTMASGEQSDDYNLVATDGDDLSRVIVSSNGTKTFSDTVKLFYIAQLPGNDISKELRNDILNRVVSNSSRMACIVNDANIHSILGGDTDADLRDDYPILQNLISYLYQSDLGNVWNIATADTTLTLEDGDRVNVDGEGVAHFVHKNVYAVDGSFVNSGISLYDTITQGVDEGFDEVQYRIEQENYQREQYSQLSGAPFERISAVTRALAIQYILTYSDSEMKMQKAKVRVLELEPCYDFSYAPMEYLHNGLTVPNRGRDARVTAFMKEVLGMSEKEIQSTPAYYREQGMSDERIEQLDLDPDNNINISWFEVEIVGMSTSEFSAKIEDMNVEYDMIYWGDNTGTFNHCTGADGKEYTVFNDYSMIGNGYTHVGDLGFRYSNDELLYLLGTGPRQSNRKTVMGWTGEDDDNAYVSKFYRYSGNDILENQVAKLTSFLDSGCPIIVADSFFVNDADASPIYTADNISCSDNILTTVASLKSEGYKKSNKTILDYTTAPNIQNVRGFLDTSTYVYQFVKQILSEKYNKRTEQLADGSVVAEYTETGKYQNFMAVSQVFESEGNRNLFNVALNTPKIQINMISQPIDYSYTTKIVNGVEAIDSANYLVADGTGKHYLEYEFYISNASSMSSGVTSYEVNLYVDANMDGKYVESELLTLSDIVNLEAGRVESPFTLQNGTHYQIKRELPKEYIGAVPWKLEIVDNNNSNVRGAISGLCAVKEEKRDLYICQFVQNRSGAPLTYIGDNVITESSFGGRGSRKPIWTTLLQAVPDFNIHIISVDAAKYFGTNAWTDDQLKATYNLLPAGESYNPNKKYERGVVFDPSLEEYDMLLFGFVESLMESKSNNASGDFCNARNIGRAMRFIHSEKSVLFTHDSIGAFNTIGNNNAFNMLIRDMGGMDRFGISIGKGNYQTTDENGMENVEEASRLSQEQAFYNAGRLRSGSVKKDTKEELESYIFNETGMSNYTRDVAFKPGSNQTAMVSETIPGTACGWDGRNDTNGTPDEPALYYKAYDYKSIGASSNFGYGNKGEADCKVAKMNAGAITEYPYKLDNLISVDRTHGQWYQLDLETDKDGDGEGDLVVWYTLDNYNPYYEGKYQLDGYNISHGDARNNYYIYTKDNITYSGAGNTEVLKEDEVKLFINTMVAAYRVGTKAPDINLIGDPSIMSTKTADSIPYDPELSNVSPTYPVYFQIKDNNIISDQNKFVFYKAYLGDKNGSRINIGTSSYPQYIKAKEITVDVSNNNSEGYVLHDGPAEDKAVLPCQMLTNDTVWKNKVNYVQSQYESKGIIVENENVYRIDLPISLFNDRDVIELYIEGSSVVIKRDSSNPENMTLKESEPIYTKYTISKMQLFDMD